MITESPVNITNDILSGFDSFDLQSDAMAELRANAMDAFRQSGIPTTRHEEWKYTNVKALIERFNRFGNGSPSGMVASNHIEPLLIAGKSVCLLVFENGVFNEALSSTAPEGLVVQNLATSMQDAAVKQYLGKIASSDTDAFVAINTAFMRDGVFIHVPTKVQASKPIHIL